MSYTDPSGYFLDWVGDLMEGISNTVLKLSSAIFAAVLAAQGQTGTATWLIDSVFGAVTVGVLSNGVGNAVNRQGFFNGALNSALSSVAFHSIGKHFKELGSKNDKLITAKELNETDVVTFGGNTLKPSQMVQQIASHALVAGISATVSGGSFGAAFVSAGLTKGIMGSVDFNYDDISPSAMLERTMVAATIGGTISSITGGKFQNGASTAAIAHLLNGEATNVSNKNTQEGIPINDVEWKALKDGNLGAYYQSRLERGDSYGAIGLSFWDPSNPNASHPKLAAVSLGRLFYGALKSGYIDLIQ